MLAINYYFTPLRLVISRREPVRLNITLENRGASKKDVSLEVSLPRELSFGKARFKREIIERIPVLEEGAKKIFTYDIYPQPMYITAGEKQIILRANIYKRVNVIEDSYERIISLSVSE